MEEKQTRSWWAKNVSFLVCFNQLPLTREASKQDFQENVSLDPKLWSQDVKGPEERKLVWPAGPSLACTQRKQTCRFTKDLKDGLKAQAFRLESLPTSFQFGGLVLLIEQRPAQPTETQMTQWHHGHHFYSQTRHLRGFLSLGLKRWVSRSHLQFPICSHHLLCPLELPLFPWEAQQYESI